MRRSYILNHSKLKKILSVLFILSMLTSHAQGEANIWYFGKNAGLDFNSGSPVALTNGQLVTSEGCGQELVEQ